MNVALSSKTLSGRVVDIGGGHNPNYFKRDPAVSFEVLDGSMSGINFEKDSLPHKDSSIDTVILCNVLEHVYNYSFLLSEIQRILKPSATLVGFVPFSMGYHPDPHDYFRFTSEALSRVLQDAGFTHIEITTVGGSPVLANLNTVVMYMPRVCRPVAYLIYAPADRFFLRLRPKSIQKNPLGFVFVGQK